MSGIAAAFAPGGHGGTSGVEQMLDTLSRRGGDFTDVRGAAAGAVLAVVRHEWERAPAIAGSVGVAMHGDVAVVADASLYYREALVGALRAAGAEPLGTTPGELIAAAYHAWGAALTDHLEGDWSFVLWDAGRRRVVAARDYTGSRPLHYAMAGRTLVVASTVGAVLAYPGVPAEFSVETLGAMAAGLFGGAAGTAFAAVSAVPAGHTLEWGPDGPAAVRAHWASPAFTGDGAPAVPFAEAAEELRRLLLAAAAERLDPDAPSAISLSGGWDSPAAFAVGQEVLRGRGRPSSWLQPVSMSFPEGDSGREDDTIRDITGFWRVEPRWVDILDAPLFPTLAERAPVEDEPFVHPYAGFNIALARAARASGARVMFTGLGGDHLFHVELSYLADLLRRGRLTAFARELRAQPARNAELFREFVVRPLLGAGARAVVGRLRGAHPRGYLEPTIPDWIRPDFVRRVGLREREASLVARRPGEDAAAYEKRWMLTHPFFARTIGATRQIALDSGLEQRAPLYDSRVVSFAAARPRSDRHAGRETKRLLRAAVRGLLPDAVLAPRAQKTGTMGDYFGRAIQTEFPKIASELFRAPFLAELGIVDVEKLWQAGARVERNIPERNIAELVFTLEVELWLRARADVPSHAVQPQVAGI